MPANLLQDTLQYAMRMDNETNRNASEFIELRRYIHHNIVAMMQHSTTAESDALTHAELAKYESLTR